MLIFVGVVIFSLIIASIATTIIYRKELQQSLEASLIDSGKQIIQTYQSTEGAELVPFMQNASGISIFAIQIYDSEGRALLSGEQPPVMPEAELVRRVLAGAVGRGVENHENYPMIGLPFEDGGRPYALFVILKSNSLLDDINNAIHTALLIVLVMGSLLILAASRYIVKPLILLRDATKRLAQGRFDVQIRSKRKDEIGQLNASFNEMAIELAKLDRMRQDFVANVSHEIQTPLTSISGFTKALKRMNISEESRMRYLTIIEEESERLSRLSRNLLRLSTLQIDHSPVNVKRYRLDEQLRKIVIALEPQWKAKGIHVELDLSSVAVQADEDQLSQVWTNLLGNAVKFTPEGGEIRIRLASVGQSVVVSVADNGIGIPAEERFDIFKPFHKVDKARNRSVAGSGLGLSIVKQIVDIHGGEIRAESGPGAGSTFVVRLPLRHEPGE